MVAKTKEVRLPGEVDKNRAEENEGTGLPQRTGREQDGPMIKRSSLRHVR